MADGTILVVDDELEVCELISDWLSEEGRWTVDYTTEPLRALEQIAHGSYDVVVTDLRMPEMDGLELARQARGMCPDVHLVAITGYASVPSSVEALRQGFTDYLEKPFRGEQIRAAVYRAMVRKVHAAVEEQAADEVTHENAVLSAAREDLDQRLELVSRELATVQHRLAGRVADMEARCESADTLEGLRDVAQLQGVALVVLRQAVPADEYLVAVCDHDPLRTVSVARIEGDEAVVTLAEQKLSRGVMRAVIRRGQTALVEDAGESAVLGDLGQWVTRRGSLLVMPLMANGRAQGVAVVRREENGREAFSHAEVRRAMGHCGEIGKALDTAMTLRRQQAETYAALTAMVDAMESRRPTMAGHSRRVARWAGDVASRLGIADERAEMLRVAGRLHDIGKLFVPDAVIEKVGPLTESEREHLSGHCELGWQLLRPVSFLEEVASLVRWHHDMTGDVEGIGLEQQILASAETFDELTRDGPHGPALTPEEALAAMQKEGYADHLLQALSRVALLD